MRFLDEETLETYKRAFESADGETLAAGASKTYYLPLIGDPLVLNEVFLSGFAEEISYVVHFNQSAWTDGTPNLNALAMMVRHMEPSNDEMEVVKYKYNNFVQDFRYRELVEQNFSLALEPSSSYEVIMSGCGGPVSDLIAQIFQNGELIEDLTQHIESYNIQDSSGGNMLGSSSIDVDYHRSILNADHEVSDVITSGGDSWLAIPFSQDLKTDYSQGQVNGFIDFTKHEKFMFKTNSSLTAGDYTLRLTYGMIKNLRLVKGRPSIE